ncbi:MAG: undecaprenyl/decaprenyl-phosphate alpha-N-acetylglucosaminyl 1-phosphate transferase [Actinomycetota bacterium]|nr:undecaprenyl/decaprenyl-phosphate alpha-N-acetylglucosaminyl 1-phosphate transferase [Actinomycetota bacterium]
MPLLRRVALAADFVDQPAERKSHITPVPYLGGVGIMIAVLLSLLFESGPLLSLAVLVVASAVLGLVGLIDDARGLNPMPRLAIQFSAAAAATSVGIRAEVTGVPILDVAVTVLWIMGITNAFNLIDNMDGLAAAVALTSAGGVFLIAALGGQRLVATLAAGVAGACLGFLAHNRPPARIFMGDAGSLFLGFVVALAALTVDAPLARPAILSVPLLLVAIPLLDTGTVTIARLRNGRPIAQGGKDHLSHRIARRTGSRGVAVLLLVLAQALLAGLAVGIAHGVLAAPVVMVLALIVLGAVASGAWPVQIYSEPPAGLATQPEPPA